MNHWHDDFVDKNNKLFSIIHSNIYETEELWINGKIEFVFKHKLSQELFAIVHNNLSMTIHQYYIYKSKCAFFLNQTNIKIPKSLAMIQQCGYAHSLDGHFLFICGGFKKEMTEDIDDSDETEAKEIWSRIKQSRIFVFHLVEMKIYECAIQMPPAIAGPCHAICMKDEENDELTVNGFVRNLYKQEPFQKMQYPPNYLIKIIQNKYYNEYLHIIHISNETKNNSKQYKINTINILNAIKS